MIDETDYIIDQLEKEVKSLPDVQNQCVQHLIELGYIPILHVNAMLPNDITQAKATFLKDAISSGLYNRNEFSRKTFEDEDEFLSALLERAVDIDEGFVFESLPFNGERSLQSRIVHYRLDIFGLWPFAIDAKFSIINSVSNLKVVGEYVGCTSLEAANYLADIETLTQQLLSNHQAEKFVVFFKSQRLPNHDLTNKLDRKIRFKKQLIRDFGERTSFIKTLNQKVFNNNEKNIDYSFLRNQSINPFSCFVLRLIQVHQWQDGLYQGLLDSDMGEDTIQSIVNAIELYNLANNKSIQNFKVLTYISKGYFLFNALFFLQEYVIEENTNQDIVDAENIIVEDILLNVQESDDNTNALFVANMALLKTEIKLTSQQKPEEKHGLLKRIYFGIKNFFNKLLKISRNIFNWIVKYTKKFWGLLKKVFSHFFSKLEKGIKAFLDGIKYLVGKKSTTTKNETGLIASKFSFDGDSFCLVSGSFNEIINDHIKQIKYNVSSMAFSLDVVGGVLKIIITAVNVLSWPLLIFSIIKTFKQISESYQKIELKTT